MAVPVIPLVLAAIRISATAWRAVCNWGAARERHRAEVIGWRRADLLRERQRSARKEAKRLLQAAISTAIEERRSIQTSVSEIQPASDTIRDHISHTRGLTSRQRRDLWHEYHRFEDVIGEMRASAHRYTAFINEAKKRVEAMYAGRATLLGAAAANALKLEEFFAANDIPVAGRVVRGIVRSPRRGLWIELDAGIRGRLAKSEVIGKWSSGKVLRVFVEHVHYRDMRASVSVDKAVFLEKWGRGRLLWTGVVADGGPHGTHLLVGRVRVFVPASRGRIGAASGQKAKLRLVEVDPRLHEAPGMSPVIAEPAPLARKEEP